MNIGDFCRELFRRNKILASVALANLILFFVLAFIAPFDSHVILGVNRWFKPMKFALSIAIYTGTLAWLLAYIAHRTWAMRVISWGVGVSMIVEIFCILLQPARGTTSHFNTATGFDVAVFSLMGIMIIVNTLLAACAFILFFTTTAPLPAAYLWGIRLGLGIFILAGIEGTFMLSRSSHSVGLHDGGPGLPFVNWSRGGGDLRIAHFMSLHALQLIPLAGFVLHRHSRKLPISDPTRWTFVFASVYVSLATLLFLQAMMGRPLIPQAAATNISQMISVLSKWHGI
ncbi:MAG: hypothetical protein H0T92_13340 [Pyrinomonadaceae bacterium]|nr:hypothetical protein [Pyrinomonadaceae bacterium]